MEGCVGAALCDVFPAQVRSRAAGAVIRGRSDGGGNAETQAQAALRDGRGSARGNPRVAA
eukprot:873154-Pyramimonas_sp.AAC.1